MQIVESYKCNLYRDRMCDCDTFRFRGCCDGCPHKIDKNIRIRLTKNRLLPFKLRGFVYEYKKDKI